MARQLFLALVAFAGCGDPDCPEGTEYDGYRCANLDAGADASGGDASSATDSGTTGRLDGSAARDVGPAGCGTDGCDLTIACSRTAPIGGFGNTIAVEWTGSNIGMAGPTRPFSVAFSILREDTATFEPVGDEREVVPLGPGGVVTRTSMFSAPPWLVSGTNDLKCRIDSLDENDESDEENNEDVTALSVTGLPDLSVQNASVPGQPYRVLVGSEYFNVQFDVVNVGVSRSSSTHWIVSGGCAGGGGTFASGDEGPLPAGVRMTVMTRAYAEMVPCYGDGQVIISVDQTMDVTEADETNNEFVRSVNWD